MQALDFSNTRASTTVTIVMSCKTLVVASSSTVDGRQIDQFDSSRHALTTSPSCDAADVQDALDRQLVGHVTVVK